MKLLVAIGSKDYKHVGDKTLRWAARAGFDIRLFVPKHKRRKYLPVLEDVNYHFYIDLDKSILVSRESIDSYARRNGYDLVLLIPEDLIEWRKGTRFKDNEIYHYVKAVMRARLAFSQDRNLRVKHFTNGCIMERLW